jgi:hypothetical protein
MLLTTESTIRCRCGRELSALREITDSGGGKKFLTQRCEGCGQINLIRNDGVEMPTH